MNVIRQSLTFAVGLVIAGVLTAQSVTLKGVVKNANKEPLQGVHVTSKKDGTTNLNVTDQSGRYTLSTEKGAVVTFSKVGFTKRSLTVQNSQDLDVVLQIATKNLSEVNVTESKQVNQNLTVVRSNRLGVKAVDMPTSTSVVDSYVLEQQEILKPSEAFLNVAGVYQFNQGYGGTGETVGARGLSLRYQGYMFRDGLRMGADQSSATPEMQNFERVEAHKGASGVNFGYTSVGAAINYVTKRPTFQNGGKVSFRAGQFSFLKPSMDVNFKVSDKLGVRYVGSYENAGSFREKVKSSRISNFVAAEYKLDETSSITLNFDQLYDKGMRDFGLPVFKTSLQTGTDADGKAIYTQTKGVESLVSNLDRTRFLGSEFNNRESKQYNGNVTYNKQFNQKWNLSVRGSLSDLETSYQQTGSGFRNKYKKLSDGAIQIIRTYEKGKGQDRFTGAIANLTGEININENIKNKMSFSVDVDSRNLVDYYYDNIGNFDTITLASSKGERKDAPKNHTHALERKTNINGYGIAFQNLLSFYDKVNVLLSLRYDNIHTFRPDATYLKNYRRSKKGDVRKGVTYNGGGFSPSVGLVYKITPTASVYGSFLSSIELNRWGRVDKDKKLLPGYLQQQMEIGAKQTFLDGRLNFNVCYYYINTKTYRDISGNRQFYEISNGTIYKGIEFETSVSPMAGLTLSANYSNIQAKYAAGGWFKEGTRPQQTPEHQIGFSAYYTLQSGQLKGLNFSLYGQYTGDRLGNDNYARRYKTTTPYIQDAYTMLSLGAGYTLKQWDFKLKVANLLDTFVFYSYRYGSVNPIAPRTISMTVGYTF